LSAYPHYILLGALTKVSNVFKQIISSFKIYNLFNLESILYGHNIGIKHNNFHTPFNINKNVYLMTFKILAPYLYNHNVNNIMQFGLISGYIRDADHLKLENGSQSTLKLLPKSSELKHVH